MGWSKFAACGAWALLGVAVASAGCGGTDTSPSHTNAGAPASAGAGASAAGAFAGTNGGDASPGSGGSALADGGSGLANGGADLANGGADLANGGASIGGSPGPTTVNFYLDELRGREGCLPRSLPVAETAGDGFEAGQARCQIDFATPLAADAACSCDATQHLKPAAANLLQAVADRLELNGTCGGVNGADCQNLCVCELEQSRGEALSQCQTETTPIAQLPPGFCYVDVSLVPPLGNPALVASCPQNARRGLRILGPTPEPAPFMVIACSSGL